MKGKEELNKIYDSLNESEKHGLLFGFYPVKLQSLTNEELLYLTETQQKKKE